MNKNKGNPRLISQKYILISFACAFTAFVGPVSTVLIPKLILDSLSSMNGDAVTARVLSLILVLCVLNILRAMLTNYFSNIFKPIQIEKTKQINMLSFLRTVNRIDKRDLDKPIFHDRIQRSYEFLQRDLENLFGAFSDSLDRAVYIITIISIVTVLDPMLVVLSGVSVCVLIVTNRIINQYDYDTVKESTPYIRRENYYSGLFTNYSYIDDLKVRNVSDNLLKEYTRVNQSKRSMLIKRFLRRTFITLGSDIVRLFVLNVASITYLSFRIMHGRLLLSSFVILINATLQLSYESYSFIAAFSRLKSLKIKSKDFVDLLTYQGNIEASTASTHNKSNFCIETIQFKNVGFSYDQQKEVLSDINLQVKKGERIAIVGNNGEGKSTFLRLLLRLYDTDKGLIMINGKDIRSIPINIYRGRISVVFQDYHNFAMTVRDNVQLTLSHQDIDCNHFWETLSMVGLNQYVDILQAKENTMISKEFDDQGILLSGGQNQKLAIARALIDPDIDVLIMDEATSALDVFSEEVVNDALYDFSKNRVLIYVTQRLNMMNRMDCIYYFKDGRIAECGTHEELINKQGLYYNAYVLQKKLRGEEE